MAKQNLIREEGGTEHVHPSDMAEHQMLLHTGAVCVQYMHVGMHFWAQSNAFWLTEWREISFTHPRDWSASKPSHYLLFYLIAFITR